jgi:hypothetical protein
LYTRILTDRKGLPPIAGACQRTGREETRRM